MTLLDLARTRLKSQCLSTTSFQTPKDVVAHLGAMQAQDYAMSKWAVGLRMKNGTEKAVDAAIDQGAILRTHVLRPTWHLVSADDIYWMLALSGPRIKSSAATRLKELGLSAPVLKKSRQVIEKALAKGNHATREELVELLEAVKIPNTDNRAAHIFVMAELEGLICSGTSRKDKRTYALLEARVPKKIELAKEESLARLAQIYFTSRSPATLADFTWWSGLSPADARKALELIKDRLHEVRLEGQAYWLSGKTASKSSGGSTILLPAFDEYIISYKDRTAVIALHHQKKAFSKNGIFWPTVLLNGQVAGLWKQGIKKEQVIIEPEFFIAPGKAVKSGLNAPAKAFGRFLGKESQLMLS